MLLGAPRLAGRQRRRQRLAVAVPHTGPGRSVLWSSEDFEVFGWNTLFWMVFCEWHRRDT